MQGIEVSARFGLAPNSYNYCGTKPFAKIFAGYLKDKSRANEKKLGGALALFKAHYAYLRLIAKANRLPVFDKKVCEALWLGGSALKKVEKKEMQRLIEREFCGPGLLSKEKARRLSISMPDGFLPHHTFHVLYLHTITGVVRPDLENADMCRPSWGKITGVAGDKITAKSQRLAMRKGMLALVGCTKKFSIVCKGMRLVEKPKIGDIVAAHWGFAVMRISKRQLESLEKVTMENIAVANGLQGVRFGEKF